jgi:Bacteriophage tail sheath protein
MPAALTYPGVYIEEIPSGVRTITGVATSITAFIGRARRGPTNEPVMVNSFGDFERAFGGLQEEYLMSYAVRDFFLNGGSQGLIVRLLHPNFATDGDRKVAQAAIDTAKVVATAATGAANPAAAKTAADAASTSIQNDATKSKAEKDAAKAVADAVDAAAAKQGATLDDVKNAANAAVPPPLPGKTILRLDGTTQGDALVLEAADEGEWGNTLAAHVDYDGVDSVGDRFKPLTKDDLFNLTIRNLQTGNTERFLNATVVEGNPRAVDNVLKNESNLVRVVSLSKSKPKLSDDIVKVSLQAIVTAGSGQNATDAQKQAAADASKKIAALTLSFKPTDDFRYITVADADKGSDGGSLDDNDITEGNGLQGNKRGLYALDKADLFNLLCIPADQRDGDGDTSSTVYGSALKYCVDRRALLIVDSPANWSANKETAAAKAKAGLPSLNLTGEEARNAALFFPRVIQPDPNRERQLDTFVPCGIIAGVMARTDTNRGVWKAPAGLDAAINGIQALEVNLNDAENGILNPLGINCLRFFPVGGRVVWGSRTLRGADQLADEYKYIPVRRTALYIEESLYRGLQWVVFEPNDEPLWAQIRLNVGAFMHNLFRQGAFQGTTPRDAYFVKCDKETTTQNDINLGIVNIVVGFAPLKPAEFVVIKLQQMAGQIET